MIIICLSPEIFYLKQLLKYDRKIIWKILQIEVLLVTPLVGIFHFRTLHHFNMYVAYIFRYESVIMILMYLCYCLILRYGESLYVSFFHEYRLRFWQCMSADSLTSVDTMYSNARCFMHGQAMGDYTCSPTQSRPCKGFWGTQQD